jgi:hypothetical protein
LDDKFVFNRLAEPDLVNVPSNPICQRYPVDTLVGRVVDSLANMIVFEFQTNGLDLNQQRRAVLNLDRQVAVRATNLLLRRDL